MYVEARTTTMLMAKSLTFPINSFLDSAGSGLCGANIVSEIVVLIKFHNV